VPTVVDAATIRRLTEFALKTFDRDIECLIEVGGAGLGADHRATYSAGDLYPLADLGLARILLVVEFNVGSEYAVVVALDPSEFLCDVLSVMIGNLNISAPHNNIHATSLCS
jgi:hypothetical protein